MKKNRKNKTKSLLVSAVLAGVLGAWAVSPVCPVGTVAEAAEMPVFGLWNEGLKLSHVHWAFPQTVISPTQLTGGQTLNLSAGYYVLSDEWDYVDSLVGSTLNILDGAYLNGRNNIIKGLNLNLSGNACAENIDSFEYGNLTMADNSKLYVGGRVGMTAGLPATATINGGEMSCSEEMQSIDGFIVNGTVHVRDKICSMSIKVGPEGKLYLGNFAGRDGSTDILNEGTVYGGEVFLKTLEHDDEPLPFYVHGGKVVLQPDLVLEGEDYQRVSEHFTYGSDSQDVRIFADDVKLGMDVALEEDSTSSLGFKLKFSDPIALGTEESILSYPLQAGSTLVVQPNIPNFDFDTFFKSFFNDGDELSGVAQVVDNRNDSLYTLKCPETYVFGRGVNRKGLSIELELGDAEISLGGVYSNQKVDVKVIRLEPFSTEWFDYQRHVLEKRDYGGDYALFQTDELCYRTGVNLGYDFIAYIGPGFLEIPRVFGDGVSERNLTVYGNNWKFETGGIEINEGSTLTLENVRSVSCWDDLSLFDDGFDFEEVVSRMYAFRNGGTLNLKGSMSLKGDILAWNKGGTEIVGTTNIDGVLGIEGYRGLAWNGEYWYEVDIKNIKIENNVSLQQGGRLRLNEGISLKVMGNMTTEQGTFIEGGGADSVLTVEGNFTVKGLLSTAELEDSVTKIHVNNLIFDDTEQHSPVYLFNIGQGEFKVEETGTGEVRLLPYWGSTNPLVGKDKVVVFTGGNLTGLTLRNTWVTDEATQKTYLLTQNETERGSLDVKESRHNAVVGIRSHKGDFVNETAILFATNVAGGRGTCTLGNLVRLAPVSGDMTTIEPLVDDAYLSKEQQTERVTGDIGIDGVELDGGKVKVQYSGALFVDDKSYISLLIADGDVAQDYFAYGNLTNFDRGGNGTVTVDLGTFADNTKDLHGYALTFFNEYGKGTSFAGELNYLPGAFTLAGGNLTYTAAADKLEQDIKVGKNNVVELTGTGTLDKVISGEGKVLVKDNITANGNKIQVDFETAGGTTMNISGGNVKGSLKGNFNLTGDTAFSGSSLQGSVSGEKKLTLNNDVQINGILNIANLDGNGKTLDMRQTTGTVGYNALTIDKLWSNANWAIDVSELQFDRIELESVEGDAKITLNAINFVGTLTGDTTVTVTGVVSGTAKEKVVVATGLELYMGNNKYTASLNDGNLTLAYSNYDADGFKGFIKNPNGASYSFGESVVFLGKEDETSADYVVKTAGADNYTKTVFMNGNTLNGYGMNNRKIIIDGTNHHTLSLINGKITNFDTALTVEEDATLILENVQFEYNANNTDVENNGTMKIRNEAKIYTLTGSGTTDITDSSQLILFSTAAGEQKFAGDGVLQLVNPFTIDAGNLAVAKTNLNYSGLTLTLTGGADDANRKTLGSTITGNGKIMIGNGNFVEADTSKLGVAVENNGNLKLNSANEMTLEKDITGTGTLEFAKDTQINSTVTQNTITVDAGVAIDVNTSLEATTSIENHGSILIDAGALKSDVTNDGSGTYGDGGIMHNGAVYLYNSNTEASKTLTKKITNGKVIVMNDVTSSLQNLVNTDVYLAGGTNLTLRDTNLVTSIDINIKGYDALYSGAGTGTLITDCTGSAGTDYKYTATFDNIQVPLVNRGILELSVGSPYPRMDKMTSITNSGTLSIGADITLDRNISNSGTLNINGCLFSGEMTNSGTVTFKRVEGATTSVCTITGTINNSGTVEIKEGNTFDTTAKVIGGILNLKGDYTFSNDNIQGLTELYVDGATYNFNAELGATPSVELIDAEKVTGTLNLGIVTATVNNSLSEWALNETKTVPYLKENDDNNVTIDNSVCFFSDNSKYTFAQAMEGGSEKIGYMSITKEEGILKLWQIIRAKVVEGYNAGNVASFNLADDYTVDLTGADAPTDELGILARVPGASKRTFTINGNNHIFDGNNNKGITVNSGDVLNLNNISEIKGWQDYVVNNSGIVNFVGTNVLNSVINGNGNFYNSGELTVADVSNLTISELNNSGTVKIGNATELILGTKINGGALGIIGNIKVEDATKLAINKIDIDVDKTLTVNGGTALGEMTIRNKGTIKLNVENNNALIVGGTVDVNADLTTKMDKFIVNVINIADGKTLSVAADARAGEGYLSSIRTVNGVNSTLKVTEGKLYASKEIYSKIVLEDNAETAKAVKLTIGPENIKNTVKIMGNANLCLTDGNLGASTIDSNSTGTVNFLGNITMDTGTSLPKATFANGSTLTVEAKTDTAPLTITDTITVDSGAKLYVNGAEKNGTYKIVSGTPINSNFTGWTLCNIRGEDANGRKVKGKEYTVEGNVYSVLFKTAVPENTDLGNLLENAEGTPLADWAEKVCDYFDTAYGDAGEAYTTNAINSMASASVLAGAQKGAATMVTQVAGNISANVGVGSRSILGNRNQDAGLRGVSADVKLASPLEGKRADKGAWSGEGVDETAINTVEVGKASEVMPTEYKDKVYDKQVWASYIHSKQKIDGLKTGSLTQNSTIQLNGVTVGADLWSGKKSFGGLAITYADGNANSSQMSNSTKNEAKYYGISMYHRQDMGKYALTTDIGYTYNKNDITQHTTGITDEVTSKPKTHAYTVGMKLEREIYLSKACKIVPFAGARYTRLQNRDFSNSLGAITKVDNQNLVTVPVGLSFHSHLVTTEGWKLGSILEGGYEWNFGNRHSTQEFGYGGAYSTIGFDVVDRGQYFVKAALTADYQNMFFELGYRYSKGKSVRDNKWNFNANFIF